MLNCLDIRDQIKGAKIGAINRCPEGVFLDKIVECLDYIENDLRIVRNRFVHDIWAPPLAEGNPAVRLNFTPRATKVATTGVREVFPYENLHVDIAEIRDVVTDIISEREYLMKIVECFQKPEDIGLPAQLSEPPPRLHLRRQREKQRQRDSAAAKPKRQPKSSRK
jgi:hypothetical protein